MILINFHNSLPKNQQQELEILVNQPLEREIRFRINPESDLPVQTQAARLMGKLEISPEELDQHRIVAHLPDHTLHAVEVLAALRGRLGFFPWVFRTRVMMYSVPPRSEITDVIDLETIYQAALPDLHS